MDLIETMKSALIPLALVGLCAGVSGCKKSVPTDIVQKSLTNAMRHAPSTASAMCGTSAKGLTGTVVTVKSRGENNTGVAHIKGSSLFAQGGIKTCEGDVEFAYSFTSKTTGPSRNRRTMTTWYLDHMKLVAVQTPGVTLKGASDEKVDDDDE